MIEPDWTGLERRALPAGQHPMQWPGWGIARADAREIDLESLNQAYLYAGNLLGGMVHPRIDLRDVVGRARRLHPWFDSDPVVLPPLLLEYSLPPTARPPGQPPSSLGPVTLPRVASIALLRSQRVARDPRHCFSSLVVIWFQDAFGDAPEAVQAQIAALDWDALAFDWTP